MHKALSLVSGGLDSLLATKLIMEQGVYVEGINFFTGFTGKCELLNDQAITYGPEWVCQTLGIKLNTVDISPIFKSILLKPQYGYGANLNPCLDCKLFMIMQAKKFMEEHGFDFLVTGEVVGQRPKSQRRDTLPLASKLTANLIVRPLSAQLLFPTLPEQNGWIKRELLGKISGRSRSEQIKLAAKYGYTKFPQPGGGCFLTDTNFCRRLQDLLDHRLNQDYSLTDILLLRFGRHLRINGSLKLIIGRDELDNNNIERVASDRLLLQTTDCPGALVLLDGDDSNDNITTSARTAGYFSKGRTKTSVKVMLRRHNNLIKTMEITPLAIEELLQSWYL